MKFFDRLYIHLFLLLDMIVIFSIALVIGLLRSSQVSLAGTQSSDTALVAFSASPSLSVIGSVVPTYTVEPSATATQSPAPTLTQTPAPSATLALDASPATVAAPYNTPASRSAIGGPDAPTAAPGQDLGILPTLPPGAMFVPPGSAYVSTAPDCVPHGLPVAGILTQYFSWYHPAIDLAVPIGTTVLATQSGQVIYAGWRTDGYGFLVIVQNGRFVTYYAHNSQLLVSPGQIVQAGDSISLSGTTGHSSGPHVHYEIHIDDFPVNPLAFYPQQYVGC